MMIKTHLFSYFTIFFQDLCRWQWRAVFPSGLNGVPIPMFKPLFPVIPLLGASIGLVADDSSAPDRPDGIPPSIIGQSLVSSEDGDDVQEGLSLYGAIHRAIQKKPELKAHALMTEAERSWISQMSLWPNPGIELERENFGGDDQSSGAEPIEDTLSISQLLPLNGTRKNRLEIARAEMDQAAWNYHVTRLNILKGVTHRYIDTLAAEWRMELVKRRMDLATKLQTITRKRIEAGETSPVESSRVAVPITTAEIAYSRAKLTLGATRSQLALAMGESALEKITLTGNLDTIQAPPEPGELTRLIHRSPEVARWASEISARTAERQLAESQRFPNPTVRFGITNIRGAEKNEMSVGIALPIPLFDRNQGSIAAARFRERAVEKLTRAAEFRVESDLIAHRLELAIAYTEAKELKEKALPAAKNAWDATFRAFSEGEIDYLDVLDASQVLLELENQYLDALVSYHYSAADLAALLGGSPFQEKP